MTKRPVAATRDLADPLVHGEPEAVSKRLERASPDDIPALSLW
ncbi:MAG: hypothetical protein WCA32_20360 [Chromatiaceae bacterium]